MKETGKRSRRKPKNITEFALDKCQVSLRIPLETKYRIWKKYGRGKALSTVLSMALEDCADGVALDGDEIAEVEGEMKRNYQRRMELRAQRGTPCRSTYTDYTRFM